MPTVHQGIEPARDPLPESGLSRVLIVDDEPDIRLVFRMGLEAAGISVAVAGSAAEAIEVAATFLPEIVLLDVEMPGVDGVAALEQLRRLPECQGARIAFLTARADAAAVAELRRLDVLAVLVKPVDPLHLAGLLRGLWGSQCSP
jgi:CheY-like chemotaxis protein